MLLPIVLQIPRISAQRGISYTKVAPTTEKEGSISGVVRLTVNGVSEEVPFSYTIAKLSKQDSTGNSTKESFPYIIATASSAKFGNPDCFLYRSDSCIENTPKIC